jgi:hypothetical protein
MRALAVIVARVLMVVGVGVVFVRSSVWVSVAQGAVTVQVAFDKLIGGGGHRLQVRWVRRAFGR